MQNARNVDNTKQLIYLISIKFSGIYFWVKTISESTTETAFMSTVSLLLHMCMTNFLTTQTYIQMVLPNVGLFLISIIFSWTNKHFSQISNQDIDFTRSILSYLLIQPLILYAIASVEYQYRRQWIIIDTYQKTCKSWEKVLEDIPQPMFIVMQNLDILLYNYTGYQLIRQVNDNKNDGDQRNRLGNLKHLLEEENMEKVQAIVEQAYEGKVAQTRIMVVYDGFKLEYMNFTASKTEWKGKKAVILLLTSCNEKIVTKEVQKTVEKIVEKEVEKIVEKPITNEQKMLIKEEQTKLKKQKISQFDNLGVIHIEPTIFNKEQKSSKSLTPNKSLYRKKKKELMSPDLSPITSAYAGDKNIEVNLNVDQEVKKNFKFLELAMTKALEKIVSQIRSYKGKKLNIKIQNHKLLQNKDDSNNEVNSSQYSVRASPKSAMVVQQSNRVQGSDKALQKYAQFSTPNVQSRKLDRLMMEKKRNKLTPFNFLSKNPKTKQDVNLILESKEEQASSQDFIDLIPRKREKTDGAVVSVVSNNFELRDRKRTSIECSKNFLKHDSQNTTQKAPISPIVNGSSSKETIKYQNENKKDVDQKQNGKNNEKSKQNGINNPSSGASQAAGVGNLQKKNFNFLKMMRDAESKGIQGMSQNSSPTNSDQEINVAKKELKESGFNQKVIMKKGEYIDPPTILCVDDNTMTMMQIGGIKLDEFPNLKKQHSKNGKDGVKVVQDLLEKNQLFHVIFMDDKMPLMDGFEATREIRKLEKENNFRRNKIIGIVSDLDDIHMNDYLSSGMDAVIKKPFPKTTLLTILEQRMKEIAAGEDLKDQEILQENVDENNNKEEEEKQKMPQLIASVAKNFNAEGIKNYEAEKQEKLKQQKEQQSIQNTKEANQLEQIKKNFLIGYSANIKAEIQQQFPQQPQQINDTDNNNNQKQNENNNAIKLQGEYDEIPFLICGSDSSLPMMQFKNCKLDFEANRQFYPSGKQIQQYVKDRFLNEKKLITALLLDINMKQMGGIDCAKEIREFEKQNSLKPSVIVLMAGDIDKVNVPELQSQIENIQVVEKPLTVQMLQQAYDLHKENNQSDNNQQQQQPAQQNNNVNQSQITLQGKFQDPHLLLCSSESYLISQQFLHSPSEYKLKRMFYKKNKEALEVIKQKYLENKEIFTAVFLDLKMQEMTGIELAKEIRNFETENSLKPTIIVILVMDISLVSVEDIKSQGADFVVEKPLSKLTLSEAVSEQLKKMTQNQ